MILMNRPMRSAPLAVGTAHTAACAVMLLASTFGPRDHAVLCADTRFIV